MEINGTVQQILVKNGKDHDVKFTLGLSDEDVVQLFRWRNRQLAVTIAPRTNQLGLPEGEPEARFWIDEGSFPIRGDEDGNYRLTGKELRELVEDAEQIWKVEVDPEDYDGALRRVLVEDSALVEIHDGDRFTVLAEDETIPFDGQAEQTEDGASPLNDSETQYEAIGAGSGRGRRRGVE